MSERWVDDAALVALCLQGDQGAWGELVTRYRRLIYSIAVAYRLGSGDADELFQRVSFKLLEGLGKLRDSAALAGWISTVSRNEARTLLREGSRFQDLGEIDPASEGSDAERVEQTVRIVQEEHAAALALERLTEPCRTLLKGLYVEDPPASYEELGRRLNRPIGSLGPTRKRCLEKLKKLYLELNS